MRHFEPKAGFWTGLAPASTVDWCEKNCGFGLGRAVLNVPCSCNADSGLPSPRRILPNCSDELSHYVAEPFNTFTNLLFLALSVYGLYWTSRIGTDSFRTVLFILGIVGLGSGAFHASLLWYSQLADELPMVFGMLWAIESFAHVFDDPHRRRTDARQVLALAGVGIFTTTVYLYTHAFAFFQGMFTLEIVVAGVLGIRTLAKLWNTPHAREMTALFAGGCGLFAAAFACWNVDNELCEHLRFARDYLPYPATGFLEMHSLWHLFSGLGLYCVIVFGVLAREVSRRMQTTELQPIELKWSLFNLIPHLELASAPLPPIQLPQPAKVVPEIITIPDPRPRSRNEVYVVGEINAPSNIRVKQRRGHRAVLSADTHRSKSWNGLSGSGSGGGGGSSAGSLARSSSTVDLFRLTPL